jgi:tetratricopeptide (TPR) repeat protein
MDMQLGQLDEAVSHFERAIAIITKTLGHTHPVIARAEQNLAGVAARRKDWPASEAHERTAIAIDVAVIGPDAPETARVRVFLARALMEQKRYAEARDELTKARVVLVKALPPQHPEVIQLDMRLAQIAEKEGQFAEAEQLARKTVDGLRAAHSDGYELTFSVMELARMVSHRDPVAALPLYDEALGRWVKQTERDPQGDLDSLRELGEVALAAHKPAAALVWFDRMPKAAAQLADLRAKLARR